MPASRMTIPGFVELTEKLDAFAAAAPLGGAPPELSVAELPERRVLLAAADVRRVEPPSDFLPLTTVFYRGGSVNAHYRVAESYDAVLGMLRDALAPAGSSPDTAGVASPAGAPSDA